MIRIEWRAVRVAALARAIGLDRTMFGTARRLAGVAAIAERSQAIVAGERIAALAYRVDVIDDASDNDAAFNSAVLA